jgi:Domain of unknown function (DUF4430)
VTPRRSPAVAVALLAVALATAGCGVGAGDELGEASLTVTRDYGAVPVAGPVDLAVTEADTAMRVLDRATEIETSYGGRFVQAIDGMEGEQRGGRPYDWFFYVNGLWAPVGAADYPLHGGEAIWWDYRDWSASNRVSALVGSWPQPFAGGYEGERHPTAVECRGGGEACAVARRRLGAAGATLVAAGSEDAIRVLVGPWAEVRGDPTAADLEDGPATSGVYAEFASENVGFELVGLDQGGRPARSFGADAGLIAATRRATAPPVWLVTGPTAGGARAAAESLDAAALRDRYAVAVDGGEPVALPVEVDR